MSQKKTSIVSISSESHNTSPFFDRFEQQSLWHIILLILFPFFVYIKTAGFEFIDQLDGGLTRDNLSLLGSLKNIGFALKSDIYLHAHGNFYRPVQTLSFMLDAWIGGTKPLIYHLSSLVYHILSVITLFYFLKSLQFKNLPALFAALIFAVHPLLSSAVTFIPARADLLITLFGLLSIISLKKFSDTNKWYSFILHLFFFLLAVFSKETALLLPVILSIYFFLILKQNEQSKKFILIVTGWALILLGYYFVRSSVVKTYSPDLGIGIDGFTGNLQTIPALLAKTLIPAGLSTMPLYQSIYILTGIILLLLSLLLIIKKSKEKNWLIGFGFCWFILFALPPLFMQIHYSKFLQEYAEYWSYFPLAGFSIIIASIFNNKLFKTNNILFSWVPVLLLLVFTILTSFNTDHYKNFMNFYGRAIDMNNPGAAAKRGEIYLQERDFVNASADFESAIDLSDQNYPKAFLLRGKLKSTASKDHAGAEKDFTQCILLDSTLADGFINRANEKIFNQDLNGAYADLAKAEKLDPNSVYLYFIKGSVDVNAKNYESAVPNFTRTITLDSSNHEAYNNRGYAYYKMNNLNAAMKDYKKAVDLFPNYLNARYNTGMVYYETGKLDSAIYEFDTTLMLANNFYFGYFYRGMAKKQKNDLKGACSDWQESVKLGFTLAEDTIKKYCK